MICINCNRTLDDDMDSVQGACVKCYIETFNSIKSDNESDTFA